MLYFRDYKNPDYIKDEPESDDDYEPSDEWEFRPGRGRRPNTKGIKRENKKPGENIIICHQHVQLED
jgi:hypothetical protein